MDPTRTRITGVEATFTADETFGEETPGGQTLADERGERRSGSRRRG
jgi:hypothetical protein